MGKNPSQRPEQAVYRQFIRFLLVGCSNFIVSFAVFYSLISLPTRFAASILVAQIASYSVGTLWSFIWNRRFTFRSKGNPVWQAFRFFVLQVSLAVLSAVAIETVVIAIGLAPTHAWFVVMTLITIVNYFLSRSWAFRV